MSRSRISTIVRPPRPTFLAFPFLSSPSGLIGFFFHRLPCFVPGQFSSTIENRSLPWFVLTSLQALFPLPLAQLHGSRLDCRDLVTADSVFCIDLTRQPL
ncbi:hypothetical protein Tcan_00275 [Toxocara canis]|uniref:Uncharacterized protein n=1 Tax=Toxocara canis TaxID=6265 RepID=A0A0B2VXK5_TOXCA|nr:hypothetical protein Tcan_00275 [Toxocara canis]